MIRYSAATIETLADQLGQELAAPPEDPFATDLVVTRSGAIQRWLAQRLSRRLGAAGHGDGVCAQVKFMSLPQLAAVVRQGPSPWSAGSLLGPVLAALDDLPNEAVFSQVRTHLADRASRPRRRMDFARLTARRFAAYATWNTDMLMGWQAGQLSGPDGQPLPQSQLWQPRLWKLLCEQIPTPWEDRQQVAGMAGDLPYARMAVFCPDLITPADEALLASLDQVRPIMAFSLPTPKTDWGNKLAAQAAATAVALDRLGGELRQLADPQPAGTLLSRVQQTLLTGQCRLGPVDDSVQIHAVRSDNQVDFLSDLLVKLLAEDPSLEPRQVLVLVNQLEAHQGLLEARLRRDDSPQAHPRHRLRASIDSVRPPTDSPIDLLVFIGGLVTGRASAEDLIRLCRHPAVSDHLGFADTDRLTTLINSSGIRWGVNAEHRAAEQMEGFAQNTWMAGLGRLVLGVALREDDLAYQGAVLPLDVIDSDTVRMVESLGQVISHIRLCCQSWGVPADPAQWAQRFHTTLDELTGPAWRMGPAQSTIAAFGRADLGQLSLGEAETLLTETWQEQLWHPWFLNGDLAVAPLGAMSAVPHRVIILAGLDAASFPQSPARDGDDLTAGSRPVGDDLRLRDRQIFFDALMAARDRFIVVYSGTDACSATELPAPTPVADLVGLSAGCCHQPADLVDLVSRHPWQQPLPEVRPRPSGGEPGLAVPLGQIDEVDIDELCDLFICPAAHWVRRNAGLPSRVLKDDEPLPTQMSVALSTLDSWQIVNRMVRLLLAGRDPDAIYQAELRRGLLPPGQPGVLAARDCLNRAQGIAHAAKSVTAPLSWLSVSLPGEEVPDLVGQIGVHGDTVLEILSGRVQPRHQIAAWIKILSLAVGHPGRTWKAQLVASRSLIRLTAPDAEEAKRHLDYLRRCHLAGLRTPLPLPVAAGAHWARYLAHRLPIDEAGVTRRLDDDWKREPSWSLIWPTTEAMLAEPARLDERLPGEAFSTRFHALAYGIYEPMMRAGGVS